MLISSFGLLILGGKREQLDGGIKYVTLNLVSTILFLSAVGLLYGMTGTLNMADLHGAVQQVDNPGLLIVIAIMFMIAFGVKAAVFPLFFLAAGLLSHAGLRGLGDLRGASDQGRGLFADPGLYADLHHGRGLYPHDPAVGGGVHDGDGRSWRRPP